jgi:hypothetical protein
MDKGCIIEASWKGLKGPKDVERLSSNNNQETMPNDPWEVILGTRLIEYSWNLLTHD